MRDETVNVNVEADTRAFDAAMKSLEDTTTRFGQTFTSTISKAIQSGKGFEDSLRAIGKRLTDLALNQALKPLEGLFGGLAEGVTGALVSGLSGGVPAFAKGAAFGSDGVVPFARGGVVTSPTAFAFGERLGIMGEAGPEAVMPLGRGPDGRLGVVSNGGNSGAQVVFNVRTNDVAGFRKSEAQITAMLARVVSRGQRSL